MSPCIYNCRHPIWKGGGVCVEHSPGQYSCVCDEGYRDKNSLDQPDCELKIVSIVGYWYVIFIAMSTVFMALYYSRRQANILKAAGVPEHKLSLQVRMRRKMTRAAMIWATCTTVFYAILLSGALTFTQLLPGFAVLLYLAASVGLSSAAVWISMLPKSSMVRGGFVYKIRCVVEEEKRLWVIPIPQFIIYLTGCIFGVCGRISNSKRYAYPSVGNHSLCECCLVVFILCSATSKVFKSFKQ